MTTPNYPSGLSAFETLLYEYIINPTSGQPNPTTYLDDEPAYWTAHNGPRNPEQAHQILNTPHLLALLTEIWADTPPTPELRAHLNSTQEGQQLLDRAAPVNDALGPESAVTPGVIDDMIFEIEFFVFSRQDSSHHISRGASTAEARSQAVWVSVSSALGGIELTIGTDPLAPDPLLQLTISQAHAQKLVTHSPAWSLRLHLNDGETVTTEAQPLEPGSTCTWTISTTRRPEDITRITLAPGGES